MHKGNIAIVGAAETEELGVLPHLSELQLHVDASLRALHDAGLTVDDVDGIAVARPLPLQVSDALGIKPRWIDGTDVGGASFMMHVRHAAAAIASGAASVVLISHGESGRSQLGTPFHRDSPLSMQGQFEYPYGAIGAYSAFTLPALKFLADRGMGREHLAHVVVNQRVWAKQNPRAFRQKDTSIEQVLDDRMIAYPFSKEMCCVVTDGGGAIVLTSSERAKDLEPKNKPIYLLGSGEAVGGPLVSQMEDLGSFPGFRDSSQEAMQTAGVTHSDIDHAMFYDPFAHVPLYMLEDIGFVKHGESGDFVAEGNTLPGGKLPMNTNGGGLSYTHTGMYGMFAIQEAVRQLRGIAPAQVPDVNVSLVQGVGMYFGSTGSLVLSNERP